MFKKKKMGTLAKISTLEGCKVFFFVIIFSCVLGELDSCFVSSVNIPFGVLMVNPCLT